MPGSARASRMSLMALTPTPGLAAGHSTALSAETYDRRTIRLLYAGLVAIPKLLPGHAQLRPTIDSLHKFLANARVIVAVLHALAALLHHIRLKDDVLRWMLGAERPELTAS